MSSSSLLLLLLTLIAQSLAVVVNRTIDDQKGDELTGSIPIFAPTGKWAQGAECPGCFAQPDKDKAFGGTWHDSTYHPSDGAPYSITLSFNGFAVYAFFITIPALAFADSETHLNMTLDGQPAGVFDFVPGPTDTYRYNQLVYSNTSLTSGPHSLVISAGTGKTSVLEFDYAVYTVDDGKPPPPPPPPPSASSSSTSLPSPNPSQLAPSLPSPTVASTSSSTKTSSTAAIVGGALGGIAILSVLSFALFYFCRRGHKAKASGTLDLDQEDNVVSMGQATHPQSHHTTFNPVVNPFVPNEVLPSGNQEQRRLSHGYATSFIPPSEARTNTSHNNAPQTKADLRQAELRRRMQAIQEEMADLERQSTQAPPSSVTSSDPRDNVESLHEEIERLRAAQQSQWGMGLSDEQPPGYAEAGRPR